MKQPIFPVLGALALAIVVSGCETGTRSNVFVPSIFGPDADSAETTSPGPASPATSAIPPAAAPEGARQRRGDRRSPIIRQPAGSDQAIHLQLRQPIRIHADGTITMSFERIGIPDFVRAVFGEILSLDYTINPGISGAISLQVGRPVPRSAVYPIAERALASAGVLVRRDGDLLIVEADPREVGAGAIVTSVAVRRLQHVDTDQIQQALQPFLAPDARVTAGPLPDSLVLSGSEDGVTALSGLVDALDINPLADRRFALFPLSVSAASQVAEELGEILGTGRPTDPTIVVIERMNAVLIISNNRRAIEEAQFWVSRLDQNDALGTQVHVYQVQNRRAKDLAELLQQALAGGRISGLAGSPAVIAPGLTEVAVGESGTPEAIREAPAFQALGADSKLEGVAIFSDEGTNSIMTVATPDRYAVVEAALRRLDVQPVQVLIEATIIEVKLTDELSYGVRWFFESGDASVSFSGLARGGIAEVVPGFNFVLDTNDLRSVISALDAVTDVEVVSSPSLMVLNNEAARLQVGDEVPIATATSTFNTINDDGTPILRSEIAYRDTGVILEITPRVNASGIVLLDIVQDISEVFETQSSGIDSPTIAQRRFESSVLLRDRETIALGGMIRTRRSDGKTGIPILSDIPILGALFSETKRVADRTELLMVIRPIVVRNHNEAKAAYDELRAKLRGLDSLSGYLPTQ